MRGWIVAAVVAVALGKDSICDPGQSGLFLPLFGNKENRTWDDSFLGGGLRALFYFFGLIWAFLGVSIIADIFMSAIETITSAEKKIPGTEIRVKVWNPTVANLTLMALGSSAPEILLSVIEILSNNFFTGDLGPSTIVGSASFNLLVITAICIAALPDGETRKIEDTGVFKTTALFSIFAYVWLLIILLAPWSPDVVDVWEAVLTLAFFPLLVSLAYAADKKWFPVSGNTLSKVSPHGVHLIQLGGKHYHPYEFSEILKKINSDALSSKEQAELVGKLALQAKNKPSRAVLRMNAIRQMTAQKRKVPIKIVTLKDKKRGGLLEKAKSIRGFRPKAFFSDLNGDMSTRFAFLESDKVATLNVMRQPAGGKMVVEWSTRDGSAKAGDDYVAASGELVFSKGEVLKTIEVQLCDDDATEDDENFFVDINQMTWRQSEDAPGGKVVSKTRQQLGPCATAEVTIVDDDEPGELGFENPANADPCKGGQNDDTTPTNGSGPKTAFGDNSMSPKSSKSVKKVNAGAVLTVGEACGEASIRVKRFNGSNGDLSCEYETRDGTAEAEIDYKPKRGKLTFKDKELEKLIAVPIVNNRRVEGTKEFSVVLSNLEGPSRAAFSDHTTLSVVIEVDKSTKDLLNEVHSYMEEHRNVYSKSLITDSWIRQFKDALCVNGAPDDDDDDEDGAACSDDDEEDGPPTAFAYFMHVLTVPWKLLFAFVPPTCYWGGWACFVVSLMMIGVVTAFIGDLAALFGCQIGLPDSITAITFVALGTSLPDAFASKTAALSDDTADASVGNVTGSNSVNVFLGLGLPWSIAAIYWTMFPSDGQKKKWRNRYGDRDGTAGSKGPRGARKIGEDRGIAFVVPAGDLGLSVMVFVCCALSAMALLVYRRHAFGAELGGPRRACQRHAYFLIGLWITYVSISSASTLGVI